MLSSMLSDTAWVIGSVAFLAFVLLLFLGHRQFAIVKAKIGSIEVTAEQINKAVNNVGADQPTLVQRVDGLEQQGHWERRALQQLAAHVGCRLPDYESSTRSANDN